MKILISFAFLICILTACSNKNLSQKSCFQIQGKPEFILGNKLELSKIKSGYRINESGENYNLNNGLIDYSTENDMKFIQGDELVFGLLMLTLQKESNELKNLNATWYLSIENKEERLKALNEIKKRFLNCLKIEKIDLKSGGSYSVNNNGYNETFTLIPRFKDGYDLNYWTFYYSIK